MRSNLLIPEERLGSGCVTVPVKQLKITYLQNQRRQKSFLAFERNPQDALQIVGAYPKRFAASFL